MPNIWSLYIRPYITMETGPHITWRLYTMCTGGNCILPYVNIIYNIMQVLYFFIFFTGILLSFLSRYLFSIVLQHTQHCFYKDCVSRTPTFFLFGNQQLVLLIYGSVSGLFCVFICFVLFCFVLDFTYK